MRSVLRGGYTLGKVLVYGVVSLGLLLAGLAFVANSGIALLNLDDPDYLYRFGLLGLSGGEMYMQILPWMLGGLILMGLGVRGLEKAYEITTSNRSSG